MNAVPRAAVSAPDLGHRLVAVVDAVPETRGIGVMYVEPGRLHRLRNPAPGEATVVFERRQRPPQLPFLMAQPAGRSGHPLAPAAQTRRSAAIRLRPSG